MGKVSMYGHVWAYHTYSTHMFFPGQVIGARVVVVVVVLASHRGSENCKCSELCRTAPSGKKKLLGLPVAVKYFSLMSAESPDQLSRLRVRI